MLNISIKTPGVYINDENAFPNSVVPVATAVPAFIGYTPKAEYNGKSYLNIPVKISSFSDFEAYFCLPAPAKQYNPQYYLVAQPAQPEKGDFILINGTYYSILPDPSTIYYMFNSIRLFYENGGGYAYIVSVGNYGAVSGKPMSLGEQLVNPNVQLNQLLSGLSALKNEMEPTLYICPEATLLSVDNNSTLMQSMLVQSSEMGTSVSIFDIIGGNDPDPLLYTNDIQAFRNATGSQGLDFSAAYYPFIGTTIMQMSDLDYTNLFGGDISQLIPLINPPTNPDPTITDIINNIQNPQSEFSIAQNNISLLNASRTYYMIMSHVLHDVNILPASGGMAGVINSIDSQYGCWQAPANVSIVGAVSLPINLSSSQQSNLNIDPVSGKSIDAIRLFNGLGILVWGARTLDGNSQDWKYLSVRRTVNYIEQSCKLALRAFAFEPNDSNTWNVVKSMISNFLINIWKSGGLAGATPAEAFSVDCGLGSTMTSDDILNGIMNVTISVAVVRPAEFIVINIQQQMATSS